MLFNKIYEKLDQGLENIETLKNVSYSNNTQIFETFSSLQKQFHDIKTHVETMHEKIDALNKMLASKEKKQVRK